MSLSRGVIDAVSRVAACLCMMRLLLVICREAHGSPPRSAARSVSRSPLRDWSSCQCLTADQLYIYEHVDVHVWCICQFAAKISVKSNRYEIKQAPIKRRLHDRGSCCQPVLFCIVLAMSHASNLLLDQHYFPMGSVALQQQQVLWVLFSDNPVQIMYSPASVVLCAVTVVITKINHHSSLTITAIRSTLVSSNHKCSCGWMWFVQ